MLEKLNNIDVRILYVIMAVMVTFPLLNPLGLPVPVAEQTKASYNAIETNVQDGDIILFGVDFAPNQEAELWPQVIAVGDQLAKKGARFVMLNMIVGGTRYEDLFEQILVSEYGYEYGVDLLSLPYSAGREAAFQSLVGDFKGLYQVDLHDKPLEQFPLWNEISNIEDFKMYVELADAPDWWLRPMRAASDLLLWNGTVASGASTMAPLYQSGQLCGLIMGMSGGAEYEILVKKPGNAAAAMDGQSLGHALIIFFVILGNVGYIVTKRKQGGNP